MEYTIGVLAEIAGITTRTLRHYEGMGLLKSLKTNSSGYRIYGDAEVDRLQQILFYRELGFDLKGIKAILDSPGFDRLHALESHRRALMEKQREIGTLIQTVEKSIEACKGDRPMKESDKFEGFKRELVRKNEETYGQEVRASFGEEELFKANAKMLNMSEADYAEFDALAKEILEKLKQAEAAKDPSSGLAQEVARLHKQWLLHTWTTYSPEAHANLAQTYVDDPRFAAYYQGRAAFLRDAIHIFTKKRVSPTA